MFLVELKSLLRCLNSRSYQALEAAAVLAKSRRQSEVEIEHYLVKLLEDPETDVCHVFRNLGVAQGPVVQALRSSLASRPGTGAERPEFSPYLASLIQDSWLLSSLELRATQLRSGHILLTLLRSPERYKLEQAPAVVELLKLLDFASVRGRLDVLARDSGEQPALSEGGAASAAAPAQSGEESALRKYTADITAEAVAGRIDEVTGRDDEIQRMIDILTRRRKNNPLIVGEAGVGKTALVEGLALRIARGELNNWLSGVSIRSLDLGVLQAGAGLRGEFEARLTAVINEVKASSKPIILFIDEAHMLIGAGNQAGGGDAANLLKPALARGELRTIAATTWSEYKKYFEKDAALRRRFQMVKVDEPAIETAIDMLRQLSGRYAHNHSVAIRDDAMQAAVNLSSRYISGRQLPDKAVDLVDRCAAYVRLRQTNPPAEMETLRRKLTLRKAEREARERDRLLAGEAGTHSDVIVDLSARIEKMETELGELEQRWKTEKAAVEHIVALRRQVEHSAEPSQREELSRPLSQALGKLRESQQETPLVPLEVDPLAVAAVVAEETGIPVGRLMSSEKVKLQQLESYLEARVKGQSECLAAIANRLRSARADLQDPKRPIGVFFLVGPSGTGKTETALTVAEVLYGGEQFLTTINMSEFLEEHSVSRLIGSPPGYVGYGEGGVLTDAVRQRPFSVILLDEVEKANPRVLNLFYQVFDRGMLADGEGRLVDFRNTVIFMTSNLGSDITMRSTEEGTQRNSIHELRRRLKRTLQSHLSPALLARMTVLPYLPLTRELLAEIARAKLAQVVSRVKNRYGVNLFMTAAVENKLLAGCADVEAGARVLDHLIREDLVPKVTSYILGNIGAQLPEHIQMDVSAADEFLLEARPG